MYHRVTPILLLFVLVIAVMMIAPPEASASWVVSDLTYSGNSGLLAGYSATFRDNYDDSWYLCFWEEWDEDYQVWYCSDEGFFEFDAVIVDSWLRSPSGAWTNMGQGWDWLAGGYGYALYPGEYGEWIAQGDHFIHRQDWGRWCWGSRDFECVPWWPWWSGLFFLGSTSKAEQVPVPFTLVPKEVSFINDIAILKDQSGSAPSIADPVWSSSKNDPVAYVKGDTMRVTVTFDVVNPPASPLGGVTIEGVIAGLGKFKKTGVTIPSSGTVSITDVDLDAPLPDTATKFYAPMTIDWRHMADGSACPSCTADSSTQHKVYVTYASPISSPVLLTLLHLAVSNDGATDLQEVFDKTWAHFTTQDVKNWNGDPLAYYGADFSNTATCFPGDDGEPLLTRANRAGQCTCFAELLLGALKVNGIGTTGNVSAVRQRVEPIGAGGMLVLNWTYNGMGSNTTTPPFNWSMDFPTTNRGEMQPEPVGGGYGEITNVAGIPGQNMPTPQEKVYGNHVFVKTIGISGGPYFDPSYGVVYADPAAFESNAIKGWAIRDTSDPLNRLRVRERGTGSSIGFCGLTITCP